MNSSVPNLKDFPFANLFNHAGLLALDDAFLTFLQTADEETHTLLLAYRAHKTTFSGPQLSEFLIECAIHLEAFLAEFFAIQTSLAASQLTTVANNPIASFKKYYVLRRAKKELTRAHELPDFATLQTWLNKALQTASLQADDPELAVALLGNQYLADPKKFQEDIEQLVKWCVSALSTCEGQQYTHHWTSFRIPQRLDYQHLIHAKPINGDKWQRLAVDDSKLRLRDGFKLTDPRMNAREVQDEVNYCIYCHDNEGDFCSKGFPVKKGDPAQGFKKNPLDVTLTGCPLDEKISEMHSLKKDGYTLAALAMVMVDNPLCPATGHRICNECMKACIYQKQDPVNIPQIETRVLTDVLALPFGVEIYDLLTRWNPLRQQQWVMQAYNGLKVMVAGMGPAGFTLAHHLLMEGFAVVGFDGLKIEPLPSSLIDQPIEHFADLKEALDERLMAGFGGVAEYGITVRWDKNFLKLIYLTLMRRPYFQVFGGVRFGGTITVEDVWDMGFQHLAVAVGAGLPKALSIPGSLATGMRQANDFLMALQLGNAAKASSLTSLQIRLPAVVIGGGLTGVDTATELQAYYILQVEKILNRYETLIQEPNNKEFFALLDPSSQEILNEFLTHGRAVRAERERAKAAGTQPNFVQLIQQWGGVTIAYRRTLQESPAYINNHEELQKALEEGIYYVECLDPTAVDLNQFGHVETLICQRRARNEANEWVNTQEEVRLPARSILAATGTQPNTAYEFEHRGTFNRLNLQYQHYEESRDGLKVAHGVEHCKDPEFGPFTSYQLNDFRVSLVGDTHPVFHGSVVKAIASGMRTYPKIVKLLHSQMQTGEEIEYKRFAERMNFLFTSRIEQITRKTPSIVELTVLAPLAAKHFQSGQFYRLQNYETLAAHLDNTLLQMEPLALVTADCDPNRGTLTFIVTENSASAKMCATLKVNEPISLMGPTGVRAKIPQEKESILIIGHQSSFAFVRSHGKDLRRAGNRVLFLCQVNSTAEIFCQTELENATDRIIWLTADKPITPNRPQDIAFTGNQILEALLSYADLQKNADVFLPLPDMDRIYIVGDTELLREIQTARSGILKDHFVKDPKVFGSVYGNMQCMLKGVCAQCLQWQLDPETGQRTKAVFACSWQDQPLEIIDIDHIEARALQNHLFNQINNLWIDYLFAKHAIARL